MLQNTFIVHDGGSRPPEVHVLCPAGMTALAGAMSRARTDNGRLQAARQAFPGPADDGLVILPVPSIEAASYLAMKYAGIWRDQVRGIAACIATGTLFPTDTGPAGPGGDGGPKVPARPPAPCRPPQGGRAPVSSGPVLP